MAYEVFFGLSFMNRERIFCPGYLSHFSPVASLLFIESIDVICKFFIWGHMFCLGFLPPFSATGIYYSSGNTDVLCLFP